MKFRPVKVIFYLLAALFFITTAFYLLYEKEYAINADSPGDEESFFAARPAEGMPAEKELIYYPGRPAPGDFLIVEAGPFSSDFTPEIKFDFPGVVSEYYRAGNLLYVIIAVGLNTEPGIYRLSIVKDPSILNDDALLAEIVISDKDFTLSRFSMPPDRTAGWTAARLAEDREKIRLAREMTEPYPLWLQTFILPLEGRVSSEYGAIRIINDNPPRRHLGVDIAAEEGSAVLAPNRGIVRLAEFLLSGGNTVIIDHGLGISSTYMHLHDLAVEVGQLLDRGALIGTVGMTGYATGPHLHWEVNIGQTPVNPEQLMQNELLFIAPAYLSGLLPAADQ